MTDPTKEIGQPAPQFDAAGNPIFETGSSAVEFNLDTHRISKYGPLLFGHDGTTVTGESRHYDPKTNTVTYPEQPEAGFYTVTHDGQPVYRTDEDESVVYTVQVATLVDQSTKVDGWLVIRSGDRIKTKRGVRTVSRTNFEGKLRKELIDGATSTAQRVLAVRWDLGQVATKP